MNKPMGKDRFGDSRDERLWLWLFFGLLTFLLLMQVEMWHASPDSNSTADSPHRAHVSPVSHRHSHS